MNSLFVSSPPHETLRSWKKKYLSACSACLKISNALYHPNPPNHPPHHGSHRMAPHLPVHQPSTPRTPRSRHPPQPPKHNQRPLLQSPLRHNPRRTHQSRLPRHRHRYTVLPDPHDSYPSPSFSSPRSQSPSSEPGMILPHTWSGDPFRITKAWTLGTCYVDFQPFTVRSEDTFTLVDVATAAALVVAECVEERGGRIGGSFLSYLRCFWGALCSRYVFNGDRRA